MKTIQKNVQKLVAGLLLIVPLAGHSQIDKGFHHGFRVGIGESILRVDQTTGENSKLFLTGGLSTNYQFNRFIGLSADFLVAGKGGTINGVTTESGTFGSRSYTFTDEFKLNYVDIPLMAKLSIPLGDEFSLRAYTGPSFNFLISAYQTREYDDPSYNDGHGFRNNELKSINTADNSWIFGVGIDVNTGDGGCFILDLRSSSPTGTVGRIYDRSATSGFYCISLGYVF